MLEVIYGICSYDGCDIPLYVDKILLVVGKEKFHQEHGCVFCCELYSSDKGST